MTASTNDRSHPRATTPHDITVNDTQFHALAEAVRRSPSIRNSQPWRLRRLSDGLAILQDTARDLHGDPAGRERAISCGAAVLNARVAMRGLGLRPRVEVCPEPDDDRLVATVRAAEPVAPASEDLALLHMIPRRRTHHRVYRSHAVAEEDLLALRDTVAAEGARLTVADSRARRHLADLLHQLRPVPPTATSADPATGMTRSTVLVISTATDTRHDWIVAGLALERMILTAGLKGLVVSFAEQDLQDIHVRPRVTQALRLWGVPQSLLRIGRALVEPPNSPRLPLNDLIEP